MQEYPYFSPLVLTDNLFVQYGGQTGTSTVAQRQAAFLMAEKQMTQYIRAFLAPTIITGSAFYQGGTLFETEFGYIQRVLQVSVTVIEDIDPLNTTIYTGTALVRNARVGLVDLFAPATYQNCFWEGAIYERKIVYESGLATGTVTQPDILAALTMAAQINLNEMDISLANEGVADVGVQRFSNQSYSEERKYLLRTPFGNSAMAQRVALLAKSYRTKTSFGFR